MNRDEYEALSLSEADVVFHADPDRNVTYVTVAWGVGPGALPHGFKFAVSSELIPARADDADLERLLAAASREDIIRVIERVGGAAREAVVIIADVAQRVIVAAGAAEQMSRDLSTVERYLDYPGPLTRATTKEAFERIRDHVLGRK